MSRIQELIIKRIDENEEVTEDIIADIVEEVESQFDTKCDYFLAGDYDSPGYDAWYYVIAYLDEDGKLQGEGVVVESY